MDVAYAYYGDYDLYTGLSFVVNGIIATHLVIIFATLRTFGDGLQHPYV